MPSRPLPALAALLPFMLPPAHAAGPLSGGALELETGGAWLSRNDVRIPSEHGDRFALDEVLGSGPYGFLRLTLRADLDERHRVRLLYAPLRIEERGALDEPVHFAGSDFEAGEVEARYQFDTSRLTYAYRVRATGRGDLWAGITALRRDAEIRLAQNGTVARDTDIGFVPLLHLAGHYQLTPAWLLAFNFDGLLGPDGRAFDLGVQLRYRPDPNWYLSLGYRTLEGGVDNDEVYNFAWVNYATVGVGYAF